MTLYSPRYFMLKSHKFFLLKVKIWYGDDIFLLDIPCKKKFGRRKDDFNFPGVT
jgi:hypothetical protein